MTTLEARIAEVLGAHQWYDATNDYEYPATGCTSCDDWFGDENAVDDGTFGKHQAAMLDPVIAEAKVEALREAVADLTDVVDGIQSSGSPNPLTWQTGALAMRDRLKTRAEQMTTS